MILSKKLYIRASIIKRLWLKRQMNNLSKSSKFFSPGSWKNYRQPLRTRNVPKFVGTKKDLTQFSEAKQLEAICPTNALKVKPEEILIIEKNCIGCLECVKASPDGIWDTTQEKFPGDPETN